MSLLGRELLQVDSDLQLDVLADGLDALWRLVLAEKVLFTALEEPEVGLVDFLLKKFVLF